MLKNKISTTAYILIISIINLLLFHVPFFKFVCVSLDCAQINSFKIFISLVILMLALNALVFYIIFIFSRKAGNILILLFFILNSIAIYFVKTYGVIIDKNMIGNILNTNYEESSNLFSFGLFYYLFFLGILPVIFFLKIKVVKDSFKKKISVISLLLIFILSLVYGNSKNWLWIDKNSTKLGALVMPWSYVINTSRFYIHKSKKNKKEIILPNSKILNSEKSIIVLVIGESARSQNFSLLGYHKNTNPLLSQTKNIYSFNASSCATYTTAGIKCMLEHKSSSKLYEILPNYLYRNGVEVIWRTTNWGEPPIHIKNYLNRRDLEKECTSNEDCDYDGILLSGLKKQILASNKNKIFVVLHTSTSHGPTYNKKYPLKFKKFKPVCESVELAKCTNNELINAYDNTIIYTDYILYSLINSLKQLEEFKSAMLYVSDHGESLGENNIYLHGLPKSIAPKEQLEIPFIIWTSDSSQQVKPNNNLSQNHVFHSVLKFLSIKSPIYNDNMSVFK